MLHVEEGGVNGNTNIAVNSTISALEEIDKKIR